MKHKINITLEDILAFNDYAASKFPKRKLIRLASIFTVPIIYFILTFTDNSFGLIGFILASTGWIILALIYWKWLEKMLRHWFVKMIMRDSSLIGEHLIEITPEGINIESSGSSGKLSWGKIKKIENEQNHFFLFLDSASALIIPKNSFDSIEDGDKFFQQINLYWTSSKVKEIS